jgi:hypothetical protein
MQASEAFQSLSAKSLRVLLHALFLNFNSASKTSGHPVFKFTNAMAKADLGMHPATFTRAKVELADRGFIRWEKRGGLKGANGVPSEFSLSADWKQWTKKQMASHPVATGTSHLVATGHAFLDAKNNKSSHPVAIGFD